MKSVFLFFHEKESVARIIAGYTSIKAIKAAGINTKGDYKYKFGTIDEAKHKAENLWANDVKIHIR